MLVELRIENLGIIKKAEIEFGEGLNVLTGETGSGKSIVVNGILLLLGKKVQGSVTGNFGETAIVEGIFSIAPDKRERIKAAGFDLHDGELIIRRSIGASGKNRCMVNGGAVPVAILAELGEILAEKHGQNMTQQFLSDSNHLTIIDNFAAKTHLAEVDRFRESYADYTRLLNELSKMINESQNVEKDLDYIKYQLNEIEAANLAEGEEEELLAQKNKLANIDKIRRHLIDAGRSLGRGDEQGALDLLSSAMDNLSKLSELDSTFNQPTELIAQSLIYVKEALDELTNYPLDVPDSGTCLDEVEGRLALISQLKRKYGATISEILKKKEELVKQINFLDDGSFAIAEKEREAAKLKGRLDAWAKSIHQTRVEAAKDFEAVVTREINLLNMPGAVFRVNTSYLENFNRDGSTGIIFMIKTNKGSAFMPLNKVASGGEISRIALAIKVASGSNEQSSTIIFDEIDAGIGGKTAHYIGKKLKQLSKFQQVICVTHSAQVAVCAAKHFVVEKKQDQSVTYSVIKEVKTSDKINEVARMLSGQVTDISLKHAKELCQGTVTIGAKA